MISTRDLRARVAEWALRDDVVEKDYVIGWVLAGIGGEPRLNDGWVFKGGTCLKKCYLETFRFSEDLDFTVLPHGVSDPDDVLAVLKRVLDRVGQASGIDFDVREPRIRIATSRWRSVTPSGGCGAVDGLRSGPDRRTSRAAAG